MRRITSTVILALAATLAATVLPAVPAGAVSRDACLRSSAWVAQSPQISTLLQSLMPPGGMWTVTAGRLVLRFRPGAFDADAFMKSDMAIGSATLSTDVSWLNTNSPWRTVAGKVIFGPGTSTLEWGDWTGTQDGKSLTVPGPASSTRPLAAGRNVYRCRENTLRWPVPLPSRDNPTTIVFTRM